MSRYYLWLIVLAAALFAAHYAVVAFALSQPFHGIYLVFYGFLIGLSVATHLLLANAIKKRPQAFVNTFMATMSLKMLLSLGVLVVCIMAFRELMKPLAVSFLVLYFAFTTYEVLAMRQMSLAQTEKERNARAQEAANSK